MLVVRLAVNLWLAERLRSKDREFVEGCESNANEHCRGSARLSVY